MLAITENLPILGPFILGLSFIILRLSFKYYRKPAGSWSRDGTNVRTAIGSSRSSPIVIDEAIASNCIVCFNPFTSSITPTRAVTSACRHEIDVCLSCIAKSIVADLDSKEADQIRCPSCPNLLGYQDIKTFVDPQIFERYERYTLASWTKTTNIHACRVGTCQSGGQYDPQTDTYVICADCGGTTCVNCDAEFTTAHRNVPCADMAVRRQAAARTAQEVASATYVEKQTKACPRCEAPTQKNGGCDHMTFVATLNTAGVVWRTIAAS